jgi:hypothetical protein
VKKVLGLGHHAFSGVYNILKAADNVTKEIETIRNKLANISHARLAFAGQSRALLSIQKYLG